MCCAFRYALLCSSFVKSGGYLSYCFLFYKLEPIELFSFDLINNGFLPTVLMFTETVVHEDPSRSVVFKYSYPPGLVPMTMSRSKLPFFPINA